MKILALETATEACSAALLIDGNVIERYQVQPRMHSQLILPMLDELLAEAGVTLAGLDAIAFGRGPGAFTGVRIAVGVAQGAAFAADLPVVPVSTLAALAQRGFRELGWRRLLPAYDARMQEVYWGAYEVDAQGLVSARVADEVSAPDRVTLPAGGGWQGVGAGWGSYRDLLDQRLGDAVGEVNADLLCSAHDVALLGAAGFVRGEAVAAELAAPVYLRDKVASRPGESRAG
ncbi:tRNA (adenosine(37)-N6)-threonylcarbamoyltransferase complex dimerization subunit type 1 TsaB [Sedimenticola hydrogenitrophicus]|uniref:tRNA (adenosine(37)-N6)-threonylcarbamoyltransferase complex dimerization subunit type 1 TsaB n=1 Tax=Sedimenticola hydrogenitrophicus TaxID=2967975 RepID=UPI0021A6ACA9|nr:tRNA (adenosine(37)-N6)-threonylcarbamoyltransferase complex dimerization subunit type 1 TsaB [Sedimenticola hydrogenitrophicus]